jgi:N-acetyl-gamma-glutamyl-phosphate reductase
MKHTVYVDGQEGTTGLRIREVLGERPDIELLRIDPGKRKDPAERRRLLNEADVAFLCLPDAAAREAAAMVTSERTCLIDASTAHRTDPDWVFGLPELAPGQRERIRGAQRISNPGCHASAFILLVRPLVDAGILEPSARVAATSVTGYSGGGRRMIEQYEAGGDPRLLAPRQYGLTLSHKHLPEMLEHSGLDVPPVFMPIVGNFFKGLAVSIPLHLADLREGATPEEIHQVYAQRYAGERFVRVMPLNDPDVLDAAYFDIQEANGTNRVDLFVFGRSTQVVLIGRLDNLGKGASGAAVQSMNIRLGVEEAKGLTVQ